ncbi:hypothetical protein HPB50_020027 [Hyalomma asiaticum]|uniref:Uncharacterized protein n=1 Tax=Hyalomma asiaticum TaxID=266040 RepID=A0ACB7SN61_HYAAI|nr:hypothetical protein HPB50_020027 [Hyalomma asiaticum]
MLRSALHLPPQKEAVKARHKRPPAAKNVMRAWPGCAQGALRPACQPASRRNRSNRRNRSEDPPKSQDPGGRLSRSTQAASKAQGRIRVPSPVEFVRAAHAGSQAEASTPAGPHIDAKKRDLAAPVQGEGYLKEFKASLGNSVREVRKSGVQVAGWFVSVGCLLLCVFMKLAWYRRPNPTSEAVTLAAAFFERILWSVFLVWMTLTCSSGRGGYVGKFLSWNGFAPLSRLTFGVYLIHLPFIQLLLCSSRERIQWSSFNVVTLLFGVLVWSFLLSYAAFILCEAPTNTLSKRAIGALIGKRNNNSPRHQTDPSGNDTKPSGNEESKAIPCVYDIRTVAFAPAVIG